jgi:hypothetical protein
VQNHTIYAELHVEGCAAELYLNGIPLRRSRASDRPGASLPVHPYLVPGVNELEVLVEPGPTPSRAREAATPRLAAGASVHARLVRHAGQLTHPDAGERIAELTWRAAAAAPELFPQSLRVQATLDPPAGRWSWQDAPPLVLDASTHAEITSVLAAVAGAFERGDPSPVIDLLRVRFADGIRAYPGGGPASLKAETASYIRRAANEGWGVRRLDPAQHDFRLCAAGRLVELVDRDWQPSLRFYSAATMGDEPAPDDEIHYAMMLARIDGRLQVVR